MSKVREYYRKTSSPKVFHTYVTKMLAKYDEVPYFENFEDWERDNFHTNLSDPYFHIIFEWDDGIGYYFSREK